MLPNATQSYKDQT